MTLVATSGFVAKLKHFSYEPEVIVHPNDGGLFLPVAIMVLRLPRIAVSTLHPLVQNPTHGPSLSREIPQHDHLLGRLLVVCHNNDVAWSYTRAMYRHRRRAQARWSCYTYSSSLTTGHLLDLVRRTWRYELDCTYHLLASSTLECIV